MCDVLLSGACWSPVGRTGNGEQRLSLGQRCWYLGIVIHELGHAIGFWHEMNRPDRDSWIYVYWSNIISVSVTNHVVYLTILSVTYHLSSNGSIINK